MDKLVTMKHLNEYFSNLKGRISEKVDLSEVQLALGEMQKKLQLKLIEKEQEQSRNLAKLKTEFNAKLAKIARRILDTSSILNAGLASKKADKLNGGD